MYGKIFESLFEGSMVGKPPTVWAVWSYVIAKQKPDKELGAWVRLNPKVLAAIFGTTECDISEAVEYLCRPDPNSTSKEKGGRRLVPVGEFEYQVVNGEKYRKIRDNQERLAQMREAQRKYRAKRAVDPKEAEAIKAFEAGDMQKFEKLAEPDQSAR